MAQKVAVAGVFTTGSLTTRAVSTGTEGGRLAQAAFVAFGTGAGGGATVVGAGAAVQAWTERTVV